MLHRPDHRRPYNSRVDNLISWFAASVMVTAGVIYVLKLQEDRSVSSVGINTEQLVRVAELDPGIGEFCRFYLERRAQEVASANGDARKCKKLEDDFTPRLDMTLVALDGTVHRQVKVRVHYKLTGDYRYASVVCVTPCAGQVSDAPPPGQCAKTGATAPSDCLKQCEMSGLSVLRHLLVQSGVSSRWALPEHSVVCSVSGQRILSDEAERSTVTGKVVASSMLKTSAFSGKRAEPEHREVGQRHPRGQYQAEIGSVRRTDRWAELIIAPTASLRIIVAKLEAGA
jgi:hypothetical protein